MPRRRSPRTASATPEARCALEAGRAIQLRPDSKDTQTTALPGSHHVIEGREAALPTVPERRRTAGSGPAAAIPTLVGVSLSQHCPGRRRHPTLGAMALQRAVYRPRDVEHTVLHQVIAEHLEVFLRAVAEAGDGAGLPQFVEREFREFLTCGVSEHRVARFRSRAARASTWYRSRAKGGHGVPVVVVAG
jgi:hypothetical protein